MIKSFFICIVPCALLFVEGLSQLSTQQTNSTYVYHHPSEDKQSWQRLHLWLSSGWYKMNTAGISNDSALVYVSKSLGLSLLPAIAEGIEDSDLFAQSQWVDERNLRKGIRDLSQLKRKKYLQQMMLLGTYYAFESTKSPRYKDSSEYFLKKAIDESKTLNEKGLGRVTLSLLVKLYSQYGETAKGDPILTQLVNECKSTDDKNTLARAFLFRGVYLGLLSSPPSTQQMAADLMNEKIGNLNQASEIYHSLNNTEGEINALTNVAYTKLYIGRYNDAYSAIMKALQLENSIGYPYTHYTTDYLTTIGASLGKFGEPLKYAVETVRIAETTRDSIGWGSFYGSLGAMYAADSHRGEEALKWMMKAMDRLVIADESSNIYMNLFNVVSIMAGHLGREQEALDLTFNIAKKSPPKNPVERIYLNLAFASAYKRMKQYRLAEQYVLAADSIRRLATFQLTNNSAEATTINAMLRNLYIEEGQYRKAKKLLELYLADSMRVTALTVEMNVYEQLLKVDSALHDPTSAIKHYKIYTELIDSNYRVSKIRQAEELQVMYQTKEKQDSITLLNQQAKIEQVNLKQATLVRNMTIAGAILLIILLGLIYNRYRHKQKTNRLLESQKEVINKSNRELHQLNEQQTKLLVEKDWLIKEIHHRVKNNLQMVISLLNAQTEFLTHPSAINGIKESRERMQAIAIIHQKLYKIDNTTEVNIRSYINELVGNIKNSFADTERIYFKLDIDDVALDISQSVPLGLILNEAITNAVKYAYPENEKGVIQISLKHCDTDKLQLKVADNGRGLPPGLNIEQSNSLGLQLIKLFSEQLEGELYFINNNGLEMILNFKTAEHKNLTRIKASA